MGFHYYWDFPLQFVWLLLWGAAGVTAFVIGIGIWLAKAWSVYRIARRRGLNNAWLSWLPVGRDWILGSISDQYQYLVRGRVHSRRKVLVGFSIASCCTVVIGLIYGVWLLMDTALTMAMYGVMPGYTPNTLLFLPLLLLVGAAVGIAAYVLRCICKYDLYRSCEPSSAVLYLVLGILFSLCDAVFLWLCRNKDQGMPPRKPDHCAYQEQADPTYL